MKDSPDPAPSKGERAREEREERPSSDTRSKLVELFLFAPIRQSLSLAEPPPIWNSALAGLQSALVILIALPIVWLSPWPHLVGFAALGSLPALFGRFHSPKERSRIVIQCGIVQTGAVFGMAALARLGLDDHALLLGLSIACGLLYFITASIRPGPPGALIFIFGAGAAMAETPAWSVVFEKTATTAVVSLLSWLVCAATERWRQLATPEQRFPMDPQRPLADRARVSLRVGLGAAAAIFSRTHSAERGLNGQRWAPSP